MYLIVLYFCDTRPGRLTDGPYTSYDLNTLLQATAGERRAVLIGQGTWISPLLDSLKTVSMNVFANLYRILCPSPFSRS